MNIYLVLILTVLLAQYAISTIVDLLNVRHIKTGLPPEFRGFYDQDRYARSQDYLRENTRFDVFTNTVVAVLGIVFILAGGFNYVDMAARAAGAGEIVTGLVFAGILMFASSLIHVPFSAYETFVIEEHYGFNKTTVRTFVLDILKMWLLVAIIGAPVLAGVLWFFASAGALAWLYCWGTVTVVQLLLAFIAPAVIMPLFNKFTPLEAGKLRTAIEEYARSQDFRMKGVFTMDGSRRSGKSNAFFTGFGRFRRLVLLDTLIAKHSVPELVAVLAHEMGHYRKRHILFSIAMAVATTGLMLFLLSFFINNEGLFAAFRMRELSVYASLFFFGFLYAPVSMFLSILANAMSRRWEYAADAYAASTCGNADALASALKKLSVDNLSNLTPHPLKVALDYSHPPVMERLKALAGIRPGAVCCPP